MFVMIKKKKYFSDEIRRVSVLEISKSIEIAWIENRFEITSQYRDQNYNRR